MGNLDMKHGGGLNFIVPKGAPISNSIGQIGDNYSTEIDVSSNAQHV